MSQCPCCGGHIEAAPIERVASVVSPKMARLIRRLTKTPNVFVSAADLVAYINRDDIFGGPLNYAQSISNMIAYHQPKLQKLGWRIETHRGPYGGYRLATKDSVQVAV